MEQKFISKEIEGMEESNLEKLKKLFPSVFKDGQVDFEELKNQLGNFDEVGQEKYEFNWVGKQEAKQNAISEISGLTLKYYPDESKDAETTENLYIEGDNLKVLKLLRNNYANKIKMIYIDPPYNTGNDTFVYPDSFKKTDKESREEVGITKNGEKVVNVLKDNMYKNTKDSNKYHSTWLSMMYPRLKIAQELLTEEGVIFISIDDNEQENLKKLCDEIFGENNFINCISVNMSNLSGPKIQHAITGKRFPKIKEYILCYVKNKDNYKLNIPKFKKQKWDEEYNLIIPEMTEDIRKKIENNNLDDTIKAIENFKLLSLNSYMKENNINTDDEEWKIDNAYRIYASKPNEALLKKAKEIENFGRKEIFAIKNSSGQVKLIKTDFNRNTKTARIELVSAIDNLTSYYGDSWDDIVTTGGVAQEGDVVFENGKKPIKLIKRLLETSLEKEFIVLDFFSGSASTAHACMDFNSDEKNNTKIKYIMVQLPENLDERMKTTSGDEKKSIEETIRFLDNIKKPRILSEIGKERIRRAGSKIKAETNADIDYGFKVFKLDETNINWEKEEYKKNIDDYILRNGFIDDKQKEKLMKDFADGAKDIDIVYEILLRYYGMPLSAKIRKIEDIGPRTYSVGGVVIVCLEDIITKEIIDKLSNTNFAKLYLRDSSFKGEKSLELKQNLMTRLNLQKEYKDEKTYKVEFI